MITSVHLQKQKVLNQLVMDKLYGSKELPVVSLLAQTRYFKKLLDQT